MSNKFLTQIIPEYLMPHLTNKGNANQFILHLLSLTSESYYDEPVEATINLGNGLFANICMTEGADSHMTPEIWFTEDITSDNFETIHPEPPTKASYCYRFLIRKNEELLMREISAHLKYILESNLSEKKRIHHAIVKIQQIKEAGHELLPYSKEHISDDKQTTKYVIELLKQTIVELVQFTQNKYSWLSSIEIQSAEALRDELFQERLPKTDMQTDETREKVYKLFRPQLEKIFDEFMDEEIFTCDNLEDFLYAFKNGNGSKTSFMVTFKGKFYYLTNAMWNSRWSVINEKFPGFTKESFFEPIIKNYKLSKKGFGSPKKVKEDLKNHFHFMNKVDKFFL